MAFGPAKADAIQGMIEGPVTTDLPASAFAKSSRCHSHRG